MKASKEDWHMAEQKNVPQTEVAVKAKMQIDNHPANIEANFGDGFTLFLTQRAKLGTPISFCQWAKESLQATMAFPLGFRMTVRFHCV